MTTAATRPDPTHPGPAHPGPARPALWWAACGILAGLVGLAVGNLVSAFMNLRLTPVSAVAELVVALAPDAAANNRDLGTADKPLLVVGIYVLLVLAFAGIGRLARRAWWPPVVGFAVLAGVGVAASLTAADAQVTDTTPILVGFAVMVIALSVLTERLRVLEDVARADVTHGAAEQRARSRRTFLLTAAAVLGVAALASLAGTLKGGTRRAVEEARRGLSGAGSGTNPLQLAVTRPDAPASVAIGVDGVAPWVTPAEDFYLIDTAFSKPAIVPSEWSLRIHGMVDNEITLTYDDLVQRELLEGWVTLNCVSNTVGGDLIGNAWWSGVALAPILAEAGIQDGADAIFQTSDDGWTCATPVETVMDGRNAMLALYMNGEPLPVEHGFPVRTIVPGLYGYVSGTKWVVDMELTRFDAVDAFWTQRGWGELGPVKMASRIDVPAEGADVARGDGGEVVIAGAAWDQHTGIDGVEVAVDGGAWTAAELAGSPSDDSWTQWRLATPLEPGRHRARVRAISKSGEVQTGAIADVLPDGATGWDEISFTVA